MKKSLALLLALAATHGAWAAPYTLDASHTDVGFSVRHLMVSNTKGRFTDVTGRLDFDEKSGAIRDLNVEIRADSVDTRDEKRDQHLKTPDFFDTARFPVITFQVASALAKPNQPVVIPGRLTLHGVTRTVSLEVTYAGARTDPFKVRHAGFSATTKINRKDFGISWNAMLDEGGVAVGEEVAIEISAEIIPSVETATPAGKRLTVEATAKGLTARVENTPTLADQLQGMTENVRKQVPPETFAALEAGTAEIEALNIPAHALHVGQTMPEFTLPDATGKLVSSRDLLASGPLLVVFYRGEWCPYCNLALHALQARLADFRALGANLVAISPQTPDHSLTMQQKNELAFPVLSDVGSGVARQFGLVYTLPASLHPVFQGFGLDLAKFNGVDTNELPVPATYLVDRTGVIRQVFIEADYRRRLEPATAVTWLKQLGAR